MIWTTIGGVLLVLLTMLVVIPFVSDRIDRRLQTETRGQMLLRSAALDHELLPPRSVEEWNHPEGCPLCKCEAESQSFLEEYKGEIRVVKRDSLDPKTPFCTTLADPGLDLNNYEDVEIHQFGKADPVARYRIHYPRGGNT